MTKNRVKIYVLSLIEAKERRSAITKQFNNHGIEFEFFDGIYGRDLSTEKIDDIYDKSKALNCVGRELTKGEIGATYSHYKIYQKALVNDLDYVVVLEDDIYFDENLKNLIEELEYLVDEESEKSKVFFIQEHCNNDMVISNSKGCRIGGFFFNRMFSSEEYFVGAYGYVLNQSAIKCLIKSYMKFYFVCDHWYFVRKESKISELYFLKNAIIRTNEEDVRQVDSYIQEERKLVVMKRNLSAIQKLRFFVKKIVVSRFSIDRYV